MLSKVILWLGLLFMDELHRAVAPFIPASGGMNGGFTPPPGPSGDSSLFPLAHANEYQDRADPSHATYHNQSTHSIVEVSPKIRSGTKWRPQKRPERRRETKKGS